MCWQSGSDRMLIIINIIKISICIVMLIGFQTLNEWDYTVPEYVSEGIITLFTWKSAIEADS